MFEGEILNKTNYQQLFFKYFVKLFSILEILWKGIRDPDNNFWGLDFDKHFPINVIFLKNYLCHKDITKIVIQNSNPKLYVFGHYRPDGNTNSPYLMILVRAYAASLQPKPFAQRLILPLVVPKFLPWYRMLTPLLTLDLRFASGHHQQVAPVVPAAARGSRLAAPRPKRPNPWLVEKITITMCKTLKWEKKGLIKLLYENQQASAYDMFAD